MDISEAPLDATVPEDTASSTTAPGLNPDEVLRGSPGASRLRTRACVVRLKLKGDFPLPVRFRNVTLIQPVIDRAHFADEVAFEHCTLDRLKTKKSEFARGLSLSASP